MSRFMRARFDGRCTRCDERIVAGEWIVWGRTSKARHALCGPNRNNPLMHEHIDAEMDFTGGGYTRAMAVAMVFMEYVDAPGPYPCHCGGTAWYKGTFSACRCMDCGQLYDCNGNPYLREAVTA